MPYVENYEFGNFIFSQKGFIPKTNPVQIKGEVSLKSLNPEFIRKHKIKITDITPWTNLRVVK